MREIISKVYFDYEKTLPFHLTLIMLVCLLAVGIVPASAAVKKADAAFTDDFEQLDYIENTNGQYIQ